MQRTKYNLFRVLSDNHEMNVGSIEAYSRTEAVKKAINLIPAFVKADDRKDFFWNLRKKFCTIHTYRGWQYRLRPA